MSQEAKPIRVVYVTPEPTPYRTPLLDLIEARPDIDLFVVYAGPSVQGRTWVIDLRHPHAVLGGLRLPGAKRVLHHDYPVDPAVWRILGRQRPDVVVVAGWSTFASQLALLWAVLHRVPYVLASESHEREPRAGWKRSIKRLVLPQLFRRAGGALVTGSLAREHVLGYGAAPDRVRVFANTIDVHAVAAHVDALSERRGELRRSLGIGEREIAVLGVGRLVREKGFDTLVHAARDLPGIRLLLAGEGPERTTLADGASLLGQLDGDKLLEAYAAADVFALPSRREPWGVVVNEAAAAGLPLVLSDRVGAGADLLRPGENGELVAAEDVAGLRGALERLSADAALRERYGRRSRELVGPWGYGPTAQRFVDAVAEAAGVRQAGPAHAEP